MIVFGNLIGLVLIICIVWWFWLSKTKATYFDGKIIKIVIDDGVYMPARIEVGARQPITLEFLRKDSSACSEYVVFDKLDVHERLPLNRPYKIELGSLAAGSYYFSCQMNMYVGELIVLQ